MSDPRHVEHGPLAETVSLPGLIGTDREAKVRPGCRCGWHGEQEFSMTAWGIREALASASAHVVQAISEMM